MRVFVGYDRREDVPYAVTVASLLRHASVPVRVEPIVEANLRGMGIYSRRHETRDGQLFDVVSDAPMATQFAITRFAVPFMADRQGWALFCDGDFLFRADVAELLEQADPKYAVMLVKHRHDPAETRKMDDQQQTRYACKNWSSLVLWNCAHPAHDRLMSHDVLNLAPGRWLHAFQWLFDTEIGDIDPAWNHLVGVNRPDPSAKAAHFTLGTPDMLGNADMEFGAEWQEYAARLAA